MMFGLRTFRLCQLAYRMFCLMSVCPTDGLPIGQWKHARRLKRGNMLWGVGCASLGQVRSLIIRHQANIPLNEPTLGKPSQRKNLTVKKSVAMVWHKPFCRHGKQERSDQVCSEIRSGQKGCVIKVIKYRDPEGLSILQIQILYHFYRSRPC